MKKKCAKCGCVNELDEVTLLSKCPACGVFYKQYEAHMRSMALDDGGADCGVGFDVTDLSDQQSEDQIRRQVEESRAAAYSEAELKARIQVAKSSGNWLGVPKDAERHVLNTVVATTTHSIPRYEIDEILGVVTAECAFGMNILFDMFSSVRDFVGGRSGNIQKVLRTARTTAMDELKKEALMIGGGAVVGVDLDYSEISGGGKSMLFVVASGTAVKIKPHKT